MIIAIDFDGTVVRSSYPAIIGEQPYATEVIKELKQQGHYLILWTCRTGKELLDAINWCLSKEIYFDRINDHCPDNVAMYGDAGKKIYADVYIDDKNIGGFAGWKEAQRYLNSIDHEQKNK